MVLYNQFYTPVWTSTTLSKTLKKNDVFLAFQLYHHWNASCKFKQHLQIYEYRIWNMHLKELVLAHPQFLQMDFVVTISYKVLT